MWRMIIVICPCANVNINLPPHRAAAEEGRIRSPEIFPACAIFLLKSMRVYAILSAFFGGALRFAVGIVRRAGISVLLQLPKLARRVRLPCPAPQSPGCNRSRGFIKCSKAAGTFKMVKVPAVQHNYTQVARKTSSNTKTNEQNGIKWCAGG